MATPLLRALREGWPRARLTVLALPAGAELYRGLPTVDAIEVYRRGGEDRGFRGMVRVARRLRPQRFDLAVVCPNSASSALIAWMAGARRRIGWSYGGRGFLLTDRLVPAMRDRTHRAPEPMVEYYLALARRLGADPTTSAPELVALPEGEEEADRLLGANGWKPGEPLAGLNVGASFGPTKLWNPDAWAAVGDALAAKGLRPALLHGPGEEGVAEEAAKRMKAAPAIRPGQVPTLTGHKSLVKRLAVLVTTDTGPRHVGTAFRIPTVVVMGPTDPSYTQANLDRTEVLRQEVDCAPYRWPCHLKECPLPAPRHHQCMDRIPASRAVEAALRLLGKFPAANSR